MIKNDQVKTLFVPKYENLKSENILEFCQDYPVVFNYLPDKRSEILRMPKDYMVSVVYTVVGQPFKAWVMTRVSERNVAIQEKRDEMVHLNPDVAEALRNANHVSRKNLILFLFILELIFMIPILLI